MVNIICPNCGYEQEGGTRCEKCSSLFSYYDNSGLGLPRPAPCVDSPPESPSSRGILRMTYRVARWTSLAAAIILLALVLRPSPPPQVASEPQAAAQLVSKLRETDAAISAGLPYQLDLSNAEVNSYLSSNLALKRDNDPSGATPPSAMAPSATLPSTPPPNATPSSTPPSATPAAGSGSHQDDPSLAEVQSSVRDFKINMLEDRIQAYVLFDFHGKDLSLLIEGRLHVQGGYLRFEPTSGKFGSMPIPQSALQTAVERMLDSPENKEKLHVPPEISDIHIQNGELVVSYR
jgi:hypothetical protein